MDRTFDDSARPTGAAPAPPVHRLFAHLPRADQRRWAEVYVKGLLTTPGKKSLRRMAASVTPSPTASQSLQQFVNVSPWEWRPVRAELTRWVAGHTPVRAWTVAPVVIPKRGSLAAGVHRRFVPGLGRTVNCQLALGAFLTSGLGDVSVDWQLYLPREWTADSRLREQARIPASTDAAGLCLALLDRLARTAVRRAPVAIDPEGHLDTEALIEGLEARGHDWIVAVPDTLRLALAPARSAAPPAAARNRTHPGPPARVTAYRRPHGTRQSPPRRAVHAGAAARRRPALPARRGMDIVVRPARPHLADQPAPRPPLPGGRAHRGARRRTGRSRRDRARTARLRRPLLRRLAPPRDAGLRRVRAAQARPRRVSAHPAPHRTVGTTTCQSSHSPSTDTDSASITREGQWGSDSLVR
ncbi:IS701 family transposase [Streptomyces sp. NPDC055092]